jgi:hypothetical protein
MTIEATVYAGGVVLVCYVSWQMHRINSRRLSEIQQEVSGLRDIVSRVFLMALNEKCDGKIAAPAGTTREVASGPVEEDTSSAPLREIEPDLVSIDALCAKLVALAPPKEALPLISKSGSNEPGGGRRIIDLDGGLERRERRAAADRLGLEEKSASGRTPARLVARHQTSKIGKIILQQGGSGVDCTVRNISPAGALLLVVDAPSLPEQFDLRVDGDSQHCIARWRRLDRIGVKFNSISC